jgi:hypothetical protein
MADAAVLRGRRFGNLVLAAARHDLPVEGLARRVAGDPFPGRLVHGSGLDRFAGGAKPITDARAEPSLAPPPDIFAVRRQARRTALRATSGRPASRPAPAVTAWRPSEP